MQQGIEIYEMKNELYLAADEQRREDFHEMPLGSFLVRHGVVSGEVCEFVSHQGAKMQRACEISIRITSDATEITRVQIGGTAILAGEATLRL